MKKQAEKSPVAVKDDKEVQQESDLEDFLTAEEIDGLQYNRIFDLFKIHRVERFMFIAFLFQLTAMIHALIVMPLDLLARICFTDRVNWTRRETRMVVSTFLQLTVLVSSAVILTEVTNSSVIYHSLRGQNAFKLHMLKAVNEIVDLILKGYGQGITDNFSRAILQGLSCKAHDGQKDKQKCTCIAGYIDIFKATLGLMMYTCAHSFVLCLEMFTLHVVLTSSPESIFSFLFYNNFTEIKITVFKKCDAASLFTYAANDSVERFQLLIYLVNVYSTTSQDKTHIARFCRYVFMSEFICDQLKHFFTRRMNSLDCETYRHYE